MSCIVVNLLGTAGSGKSTGATYIFSQLKMAGINAEYVSEFAKDKVYEETKEVFNNQAYIFGKQYFKMTRCENKVDVIVTDSPIILSGFYNDYYKANPILSDDFDKMVTKVFNSFYNMNYFITRDKPYNPSGRFQTEQESDSMVIPLKQYLNNRDIKYTEKLGNQTNYDKIIDDIQYQLKAIDVLSKIPLVSNQVTAVELQTILNKLIENIVEQEINNE